MGTFTQTAAIAVQNNPKGIDPTTLDEFDWSNDVPVSETSECFRLGGCLVVKPEEIGRYGHLVLERNWLREYTQGGCIADQGSDCVVRSKEKVSFNPEGLPV